MILICVLEFHVEDYFYSYTSNVKKHVSSVIKVKFEVDLEVSIVNVEL